MVYCEFPRADPVFGSVLAVAHCELPRADPVFGCVLLLFIVSLLVPVLRLVVFYCGLL